MASRTGGPDEESAAAAGHPKGKLRRALHRFTASEEDLERDDLSKQSALTGATPVSACGDRDTVCIAGTVKSTQVDMRGGSPMLNVALYDGSGTVTVIFLGRRKVAGIEPGRSVKVTGRLTTVEGSPVMYNPSYELLAGSPA